MKCEHCNKDAIGYQGFGCCAEYVCLDHASSFVPDLKSGEKMISVAETAFPSLCTMFPEAEGGVVATPWPAVVESQYISPGANPLNWLFICDIP